MSFSVTGVSFLVLCVFLIAALGYALGRITIKGISLGSAGVFIVALVFGAVFPTLLQNNLASYKDALKVVETMGLTLFVAAVGFIAGPSFVGNFKRNFKSYVALGLIIILSGGLAAVACLFIGKASGVESSAEELSAMIAGLFSGSLTSTPAFSAAKATVGEELEGVVSVGYGIAYLFGVIGVVLFVQLIPKLTHANMEEERAKLSASAAAAAPKEAKTKKPLLDMDPFGFMPFCCAVVLGIILGAVKFFGFFSLTTTGGALIIAIVFGHFGHIGRINVMPTKNTLMAFRELGLMLFLIGAGVTGGISFVKYFKPVYFVYGVFMTLLPMIVGYFFAVKVLKLSMFNALGSITGGMTSTPALGTLVHVAGTDDVATAYAATYPIALICVVLVSQLLIILF